MNLKEIRSYFDKKRGEMDLIEKQIKTRKGRIVALKRELRDAESAHIVVQKAAVETQESLQYKLSELAQLGLNAVFDDPYKFEIEFEIKRGKTEAEFWFTRNGAKIKANSNVGFGTIDIAGLALRVSMWALNKTRPTMVLDEPFKHLKGPTANTRALQFLKELCTPQPEKNWEGIQIIMVADERATREELVDIADTVYEFKKVKNIPTAKRIK